MAMCHFSWGPLGPILKAEFDINNSQLGYVISLMYLSMVVVSIPAGILVDRHGVKWFLFISSAMVGLGIFIIPFCSSYSYTAIAAVMIGVGYGMINQITTKGIISWFEPLERGTIMGIKQMGVTLGGGLIGIYIPLLGFYIVWKNAIFLLGGLVIVIAIVSPFLYKENQGKNPNLANEIGTSKVKINQSPKGSLKDVLLGRRLLVVTLLSSLLAFCQASSASFLVVFAKETFTITQLFAGSLLTVAMAGGTLGRIVFGIISDRTMKGDRILPLALISLIGSIASCFLALCGSGTPIFAIIAISGALGVSFMGWNSLGMVLLAEMVGSKHVGSALGVVFTVAWGAMVLGPSIFGFLVDRSGYSAGWGMLAALSFLTFSGFICLYRKPNS